MSKKKARHAKKKTPASAQKKRGKKPAQTPKAPAGKPKRAKTNLKLRARNAAIRHLAKVEGISIAAAKELYPRARIEAIWARPGRSVRRKWFEIKPGVFQQIVPGQKAKWINTFGRKRDIGYVKRVRAMEQYWATIDILSDAMGITRKQARAYYKQTVAKMGPEEGKKYILVELGVYTEQSPPLYEDEDEETEEE